MILAQPLSFFFGLFSLGVLVHGVEFVKIESIFCMGGLGFLLCLAGTRCSSLLWPGLAVLVVVIGWARAEQGGGGETLPCGSSPGIEVAVQARVLDLPLEVGRRGEHQCRLSLTNFEGRECGGKVGAPFFLSKCSSAFNPGDLVAGRVIFEERSRLRNHWDLRNPNTRRVMVKAPYGLVLVQPAGKVDREIARLKERLIGAVRGRFPPEAAGVILALSTGEKRLLSWQIRERWSDTGVAHLLAISGLHVGMIAMCFHGVLFWAVLRVGAVAERWNVRWGCVALTTLLICGFCVWVGTPLSAVRATVMVVFSLWARLAGGRNTGWNGLSLAGLGILFVNPGALFSPGFLLSFISTGAVLGLVGNRGRGATPVLGALYDTIKLSLVTSLATGPVLAFCFGKVSLLGPLGNLIAVPIATFFLTPGALLYVFLEALGFSGFWPLEKVLLGLLAILDMWLEALLTIPHGTLTVSTGAWLPFTAGALLWWGALMTAEKRRKLALGVAGFLGGFAAVCGGGVVFDEPFLFEEGELGVVFPAVGQGDGAIVHLPDGEIAVVDGGGSWGGDAYDPGRRVMARYLREMGVTRIRLMVATHSHPDHVGGLRYLAEAFEVGELWFNGDTGTSLMRDIIGLVRQGGGVVRPVHSLPDSVVIGGVTFTPLHPRIKGEELYYPELDQNDNSVVFHLRYRLAAALFTGDISTLVEEDLGIEWPAAGLLKVPHHGSETSSSMSFIKAVSPEVALISCGQGNNFGLPDPPVVERYRRQGAVVLRTDSMGAVIVKTRGERWSYSSLRGRGRNSMN